MTIERQLKTYLGKFQKDLNLLQKQVKRESEALLKRVKKVANKQNVDAAKKDIEKFALTKFKEFEPHINKFVKGVNKNAKKAGIDLTDVEKKIKSQIATAKSMLAQKKAKRKTKAKKKTSKVKAKSAQKTATRKKTTANRG